MSINTINKEYASKGGVLNSNTFHLSGKNRTNTYTNNNAYAVDALVTMTGGQGQRRTDWVFSQPNGNYKSDTYYAGAQGVSVNCSVGGVLIASAAGGAGSAAKTRQSCEQHNYTCGRKWTGEVKWCHDWHCSAVADANFAQAGETKSFLVSIRAGQQLSFVFNNNGGGEAKVSVSILQ